VQEALNVAKTGDIVYVRTGKNPGIPAFTIPNNVQVLSSALPRVFNTQIGNIQLPGSGSRVRPTVTGTVTLGSNTTLDGFAIANSPGEGIFGQNISNVSISNNSITNSALTGIRLDEVTGSVNILGNAIDKTGIYITNSAGKGSFSIQNNTINNSAGNGIQISLYDQAQGNFNISNNTITTTNKGNGMYFFTDENSQLNAIVSDNTITGNEAGIAFNPVGASKVDVTVSGNTVSGNQSGIVLQSYENARLTATISDNTVTKNIGFTSTNSPLAAVFVGAFDNSQANTTIRKNTVTNNLVGISVTANDSAKLTGLVESNTVTNNSQGGIIVTASLDPSVIIDANGNPTGVKPQNPSANISLKNNTVVGSNLPPDAFGDVAAATLSNKANLCLQARGNKIGTVPNTIGTFVLADRGIPYIYDQTQTKLLSSFAGTVSVEGGLNAINTTNNIFGAVVTSVDLQLQDIWKGTTVAPGTCGFGN
jgi:hypothetical protein